MLYTLRRTGRRVASATLSTHANVTASRASGIVETIRRGRLVGETLKGASGERVCFDLAPGKGRQLGRLGLRGMRIPRELGMIVDR